MNSRSTLSFRAMSGTAMIALLIASAACAHGGHESTREGEAWWTLWNLRPSVFLVLGLIAFLYWRGIRTLWHSAGRGRGVSRRQVWIFSAGMVALLLALVSPIDVIAEELNAVHMVQHMLLIKVAAPLLVLGSAGQTLLWAMPGTMRGRIASAFAGLRRLGVRGYFLWQPLLMWASFALVLWVLHIPELYHAALRNRFLHDLQHIAFLVSACLFWRVLLDPFSRLRLNPGLAVIYLFTTTLHAGALGTFMVFSGHLWYTDYLTSTLAWRVDPLEDQQIAGYIMWMPACIIYAGAAAIIFGLWIQEPQPCAAGDEPAQTSDIRGSVQSVQSVDGFAGDQ